ncbi:MAG: ketoacyl-ACP synthase III [Ignavibacteriae bacterium]|nr:ketoacyl-ACP synthase III [Ignavibacteriota bacterium]
MKEEIYSVIAGTGSYIPEKIVPNDSFLSNTFYDGAGKVLELQNSDIIEKFRKITNISERRYIGDEYVSSDMASFAAENAIKSSGVDRETLDYIIVAHNFGDVKINNRKTDIVPSIASRVKYNLGIQNPFTVGYDIIFGCPGWLQGVIQANYYIKSGDAKRVMIIGTEALSRVSDPHDRDSMIYSDGAGAVIFEGKANPVPVGILSCTARTDSYGYAYLLGMDTSFNPDFQTKDIFLKMNGRKLYEYALNFVPVTVKNCIEKAGLAIGDINKVLIHQANEKMDEAILQRLFKLCGKKEIPENVMPMTINKLGNNSVATLPILIDLILKGNLSGHSISVNDNLVFASVGAGMNINSFVYRA